MPILCSGASPMVGLIHSFNKYGRPASLYDLFWSPVWVLYSVLWLPNRYRRNPLPWLRVAEPLPHPAAVASSRRTAAAEPLLPNCCCRTAAAEPLLPNRYHRSVAAATYRRYLSPHPAPRRGYSFRPLMASRSLVSISSASSGLSSRTFFTPSRPWASLLSL